MQGYEHGRSPLTSAHDFVAADLAALGHRFSVRCNDAPLAAALADVFAGLKVLAVDRDGAPGQACTTYDLHVDPTVPEWSLWVDGVEVGMALHHPRYKVEHLIWLLNRSAVSDTPEVTRVHAAVASFGGVGVVLPASMEAGKSTLVTALVQFGFGYLSDEIAAIEPQSGDLVAYPKPVGLDPGSWPLFPELRPGGDPRAFERQWLVAPDRIASGAVVRRTVPGLIVAPRYRSGASSEAVKVDRVTALRLLVDQTFRFADSPQRDLDVLADLVRAVPCYRLDVDDLDVACRQVSELVQEQAGAGR